MPLYPPKSSGYPTTNLTIASSNTATPTVTGAYTALTTNSVTLTAGTWQIYTSGSVTQSGAALISDAGIGLYAANGTNTTTPPTALNTICTILTPQDPSFTNRLALVTGNESLNFLAGCPVVIRATGTITVFCVPFCIAATIANARVATQLYAIQIG